MDSLLTFHGNIMTFDDLIRYKALHLKYVSDNMALTDMLAEDTIQHSIPMKNVCAMITQQLFDDLTSTCGLLDISKRSFIESAIIEALTKAKSIMDAEGLYEHLAAASTTTVEA
jgi:hypothetical protein